MNYIVSENVDYVTELELLLTGNIKKVVGFGSKELYVAVADRKIVVELIKANHYSHKTPDSAVIHLGVYVKGELKGAMQLGYAMNPGSGNKLVDMELSNKDWLELNRMWVCDSLPRNSESKVISYMIKFIRKAYPNVLFIQSFADERCGCLGVMYQASNFDYYGNHKAYFYEKDGEVYHRMIMTYSKRPSYKKHQENIHLFEKKEYRQYRYIYWLSKKAKEVCKLKKKPYPKVYL